MPELAQAGFRAIAPFTRGYAPTSLAPDDCYQTGARAADVNELHEALGGDENAVLIGHDWGASTAYIDCMQRQSAMASSGNNVCTSRSYLP